jgi:hypothetical protein
MGTFKESSTEKRKPTGTCQVHEVGSAILRHNVIGYVKTNRFVLSTGHHPGQVASACKELEPRDVLTKASGLDAWVIPMKVETLG